MTGQLAFLDLLPPERAEKPPTRQAVVVPDRLLALRPYQEQAVTSALTAPERGVRRPLLVSPTGTGKTVIFSEIARRRLPRRTLILAHRDELIQQAAKKFAMVTPGIDVGIVKAETNEPDRLVTVGSVQTLINRKRLAGVLAGGPIDTVIVDEAHHAVARSYVSILTDLGAFEPDGPLIVGVTATADRGDKVGLGNVFEEIAFEYKLLDAITDGYLCDVRAATVRIPVDFGNIRTTAGDYNLGDVEREYEDAHAEEAVANGFAQVIRDRKRVLAFVPSVESAHRLAEAFRRVGVSADAVDGTMRTEARRDALARFSAGTTTVLANCAVLTEGYDEPLVDCVIIMRPTKSRLLYTQMAGRGLRPAPGKADCLIVDVVGISRQHKLQTIADLTGLPLNRGGDPGDRDEAARTTKSADVGTVSQGGQSLLDILRDYGALAAGASGVAVEAVDLFSNSWARWLPVNGRYALPAGDRTYLLVPSGDGLFNVLAAKNGRTGGHEVLARGLDLGYAQGLAESRCKGEAELLGSKDAKWRTGPPSDAQNALLRKLGLDPGKYATKGDASDAITVAKLVQNMGDLLRA
jgi:superfamily II DNA or RNA helicase